MFFYFLVMETAYADSWSAWGHGLVGHEVKAIMTYISRFSDFALYLKTI